MNVLKHHSAILLALFLGLFSFSIDAKSSSPNIEKSFLHCDADAGSLHPSSDNCLEHGGALLRANFSSHPHIPHGFEVIYVLTSGQGLVIEAVNSTPEFTVNQTGRFTIHTLVYNPHTLDLGIVEIGVTTGFDVNSLLIQGGGHICAALDVAGAPFNVETCSCDAYAGRLTNAHDPCLDHGTAFLQASRTRPAIVPDGFEVIYVLTKGFNRVIQAVNTTPEFTVDAIGQYRIHTLVYNPNTLDLGIVQFGETTGRDVNSLLVGGGGSICADLDFIGAFFRVDACSSCNATAGTLRVVEGACLEDDSATLRANINQAPNVPNGFEIIYVLTSGTELTIQNVSATPEFMVDQTGRFTIHTLVYDPNTLDLGIVEIGVTTGVDVNNLLIQGGGDICAALDVTGAPFDIEECPCEATSGTLFAPEEACLSNGSANLRAVVTEAPNIPDGFEVIYVLTSGTELTIQNVGTTPKFTVDQTGRFTIHTLVYDPNTLDLGIVEIGVTTGVDVNGLLIQGGGDICAALDVAGAPFDVEACPCDASAGTLHPTTQDCLENGFATIVAMANEQPNVPDGFQILYVLTSGPELTIQNVGTSPEFTVDYTGRFTIHTLVYDPTTLDLGIVELGVTTGVDVNNLLIQGGGSICAALDVVGAPFDVEICDCEATAGSLSAVDGACLDNGAATIAATVNQAPNVPNGFQVLYVLTSGTELTIQNVSATPEFTVNQTGRFTIHTLVYDPTTLDLGIVEIGVTTGVDVNNLLIQGGGTICAALDVAGAPFDIEECPCEATAGTLSAGETCLDDGSATLTASIEQAPNVPAGFQVLYVLTFGTELTIQNVGANPEFTVDQTGRFTIHTLVYDPNTLDLGIVEIGVTTGVDVNRLLIQGGGTICAALDVAGAPFDVEECPCEATAGTLTAVDGSCLNGGSANLSASVDQSPNVPDGFQVLYVLTSGSELTIQNVNATPEFTVDQTGRYTIHTLVYDPSTLDLGIVEIGVTTGVDVNNLLIQGGGDICAALDVTGAPFDLEECTCDATAGTLRSVNDNCLENGSATLTATVDQAPNVPNGFEILYVLTSGTELTIQNVSTTPEFTVDQIGRYTIHTLVYDPNTLDLGIVDIGVTTGVDVNGLLIQGGGTICAALDVAGAPFDVEVCPCAARSGRLSRVNLPDCFNGDPLLLQGRFARPSVVPEGFQTIFVLTSGNQFVIQAVNSEPEFFVDAPGEYRIHSLVYDPNTLDLGIVEFGVTTGLDVRSLLVAGGGNICGSLDIFGASFRIRNCPCEATAGALSSVMGACLDNGTATLEAMIVEMPNIPNGFQQIYVLTSGDDLVIQNVNSSPKFTVTEGGRYTIHTLVYDPNTLNLSIVDLGITTGFDVNGLLLQGGGHICGALDVAGATFDLTECVDLRDLKISPNPTVDFIRVKTGDNVLGRNLSASIVNINGQAVASYILDNVDREVTLRTSDLAPGIYMLYLTDGSKTSFAGRFVKVD